MFKKTGSFTNWQFEYAYGCSLNCVEKNTGGLISYLFSWFFTSNWCCNDHNLCNNAAIKQYSYKLSFLFLSLYWI